MAITLTVTKYAAALAEWDSGRCASPSPLDYVLMADEALRETVAGYEAPTFDRCMSVGYRHRIRLTRGAGVNVSRRGLGLSIQAGHASLSLGRLGLRATVSLLGFFLRKGIR